MMAGRSSRTAIVLASAWLAAATAASAQSYPGGVVRAANVPYQALIGFHPQLADLYLPPGGGTHPAVLYLHGGGWAVGAPAMMGIDRKLASLAARGYVVMSADYRFSGEARFPAQLQDAKQAVRWLRSNALRYGVDPARIGAWGESAGGYLVAMLGTTCRVAAVEPAAPDQRRFPGMTVVHADPDASDCVQAVVDYYGPIDFASMDRQNIVGGLTHGAATSAESTLLGCTIPSCPADRLALASAQQAPPAGTRLPPFLIAHGTADRGVPPDQSRVFAAWLRTHGTDVTLLMVDHADHMFEHASSAQKAQVEQATLRFFDRTLK